MGIMPAEFGQNLSPQSNKAETLKPSLISASEFLDQMSWLLYQNPEPSEDTILPIIEPSGQRSSMITNSPSTINQVNSTSSSNEQPRWHCSECEDLRFWDEKEHDTYLEALRTACPDALKGRGLCRTYGDCHSKYRIFLCLEYLRDRPYAHHDAAIREGDSRTSSLFSHKSYMHTIHNCRIGYSDRGCDKIHGSTGLIIHVSKKEFNFHIRPTCKSVSDAEGRSCEETFKNKSAGCCRAHDHWEIRLNVSKRRNHAARLNEICHGMGGIRSAQFSSSDSKKRPHMFCICHLHAIRDVIKLLPITISDFPSIPAYIFFDPALRVARIKTNERVDNYGPLSAYRQAMRPYSRSLE